VNIEEYAWQEGLETIGNCRDFGRIPYCGEKCWIEGLCGLRAVKM
jgi:hypothetical protein